MWTWLILAGILLAVEMTTGTLALLFAGAGALAAAFLAYVAPDSLSMQILVFALATAAGGIIAWRRFRDPRPAAADVAGTEVGQTVEVAVLPDELGRLRVRYRGAEWPARLADKTLTVEMGKSLAVLAQEGSLLVVGLMENKE
ncbi:MAG: NfeD family protein [Zoogloeaceae bacterium]|jgi:membrane protein implicated in regulation of membrane protease activity|nr:NfeD family protein [Zoogloeaceae bacterium]